MKDRQYDEQHRRVCRSKVEFPFKILKWSNATQAAIATAHGVHVGDMADARRTRTRQVVRARRELVRRLRSQIVFRDDLNGTGRRRIRHYEFAGDVAPLERDKWRPISTTDVAALLRADHSTVVLQLAATYNVEGSRNEPDNEPRQDSNSHPERSDGAGAPVVGVGVAMGESADGGNGVVRGGG